MVRRGVREAGAGLGEQAGRGLGQVDAVAAAGKLSGMPAGAAASIEDPRGRRDPGVIEGCADQVGPWAGRGA